VHYSRTLAMKELPRFEEGELAPTAGAVVGATFASLAKGTDGTSAIGAAVPELARRDDRSHVAAPAARGPLAGDGVVGADMLGEEQPAERVFSQMRHRGVAEASTVRHGGGNLSRRDGRRALRLPVALPRPRFASTSTALHPFPLLRATLHAGVENPDDASLSTLFMPCPDHSSGKPTHHRTGAVGTCSGDHSRYTTAAFPAREVPRAPDRLGPELPRPGHRRAYRPDGRAPAAGDAHRHVAGVVLASSFRRNAPPPSKHGKQPRANLQEQRGSR